jgi:predicted nucleic acid-binding protein
VILVDTSVLIDFLKGRTAAKTALLREILLRDVPFGFSAFTYQILTAL